MFAKKLYLALQMEKFNIKYSRMFHENGQIIEGEMAWGQGDQIERVFAYLAIVFFGRVFGKYIQKCVAQMFGFLFPR
jgi:hypothetical protein